MYRVEFANDWTAGDTLLAEPFIASCATPQILLDAIKRHVHDDDHPCAAAVRPGFDEEEPDFDNGPVMGLLSVSNDESVNVFTATKLATVELSPTAVPDPDDELIGQRVVLSTSTPDFNPRGQRFIGTVLMSYDDPAHDDGAHTRFLAVIDANREIHIRWRRMVVSVRAAEDKRLFVLLKAFSKPIVTLMGRTEQEALARAAGTLDPFARAGARPLHALLGLEFVLAGNKVPEDIRPVVLEARDRLAELVTVYEQDHPVTGDRLFEGALVYRYVGVIPPYEREVLKILTSNEDGTVTVQAVNGKTFVTEPAGLAGRWPLSTWLFG
ncbi:hypothetical protein AB0A63_13780 [Lentzea sp. NPDC042327]|uniref:hypothetical protein n=1 Tax=Lentzea sp. NPDC042327 TaxID=3154801 RepID=UPI0033DF0CFE